MFTVFETEIKVRNRIYGTLPKDPALFEGYLKAKFQPEDEETVAKDLDLDEELEQSAAGFRQDDVGIYVGDYQIKAMLAQAASLLGLTTSKRGSKQTLREGLVVKGLDLEGKNTREKVYLLPFKDNVDGVDERTGNVSGPSGSRSIINRSEYVESPSLKFTMSFLENRIGKTGKLLTRDDISDILSFSQELGLGGQRKYGGGRFDIVDFTTVQ